MAYAHLFGAVTAPEQLGCVDSDAPLLYIQRSVTIPTTVFGTAVAGGVQVLSGASAIQTRLLPLVSGVDYEPLVFDATNRQILDGAVRDGDIIIRTVDPLNPSTMTLSVTKAYAQNPVTEFSLRETSCPISITPLQKSQLAAGMEQTLEGVVQDAPVHFLCTEVYSTGVDLCWLKPFVIEPGPAAPVLGFSLAAQRKCYLIDGGLIPAPIPNGPAPLIGYKRPNANINEWYSDEVVPYFAQSIPRYRITVVAASEPATLETRTEHFMIYTQNGNMVLIRPRSVTRTKLWSD